MTPSSGAANQAPDAAITVSFSQPLASNSPLPKLSPSIPGTWVRTSATSLRFEPQGYFTPFTKVQVTVPGGSTGVRGRFGQSLGSSLTNHFAVAGGSELRLQELLAELGYLPVQFVPSATGSGTSTAGANLTSANASGATTTTAPVTAKPAVNSEPTSSVDVSPLPQNGSFAWRFTNIPVSLSSLWHPGQPNVVTTGAVMAFEYAHGISVDGQAGPQVWSTLLQAVAARHLDASPYNYVYVSLNLPETVYLWSNGKIIYTTLANSGIAVEPTATGTYPIYLRFTVTTMSGTNPNGTPYNDPGIPWTSYFNGGDALHGFIRASYGWPQSLGCIEMPFANADVVFHNTNYGTLVTIL